MVQHPRSFVARPGCAITPFLVGVEAVVLESFFEFEGDRAGGIHATPNGTEIEVDADEGDPSHLRLYPTVQQTDCIPLLDEIPVVETLQQVIDDLRRIDMQAVDLDEQAGTHCGIRLVPCQNPTDWVVQPPTEPAIKKRSA